MSLKSFIEYLKRGLTNILKVERIYLIFYLVLLSNGKGSLINTNTF